jgi:hypothetical protein
MVFDTFSIPWGAQLTTIRARNLDVEAESFYHDRGRGGGGGSRVCMPGMSIAGWWMSRSGKETSDGRSRGPASALGTAIVRSGRCQSNLTRECEFAKNTV